MKCQTFVTSPGKFECVCEVIRVKMQNFCLSVVRAYNGIGLRNMRCNKVYKLMLSCTYSTSVASGSNTSGRYYIYITLLTEAHALGLIERDLLERRCVISQLM